MTGLGRWREKSLHLFAASNSESPAFGRITNLSGISDSRVLPFGAFVGCDLHRARFSPAISRRR